MKTHKTAKHFLFVLFAICCIMGAVLTFTAGAEQEKYWLTVTPSPYDGSGGEIIFENNYLAEGQEVTVKVIPNKDGGYCRAAWTSGDLGVSIPTYEGQMELKFVMPAKDVQISVSFAEHNTNIYYAGQSP